MNRRLAALVATVFLGIGCTKAAPPANPAPPPPLPPVSIAPRENLAMKGVYQPMGGGKYAVAIFANDERVIEGTLSATKRRDHFHGRYQGHEIDADCELRDKVDCVIVVDGAPRAAGGSDRSENAGE
ncbi:MAG: hypothetical protein ACREQQ_15210 [Candidatus Binatia bacterium]